MQATIKAEQLLYLQCPKQGYHADQNLNLVCLEKKCSQDLVCCCACIEANHKKHMVKPLKFLFNQVRKNATNLHIPKLNNDILLDFINTSRNEFLKLFQTYKLKIISSLERINFSLNQFYNSLIQQLIYSSSDSKIQIQEIITKSINPKNIEELKKMIKKLVSLLPNENNLANEITQNNVIQNFSFINQELKALMSAKLNSTNLQINQFQKFIFHTLDNTNLWAVNKLKFIPQLIHPELKLVSQTRVKTDKSNGYKFAILNNPIENITNKPSQIKIIQSSSNWLALGVCHKNIILSKNFGFTFGNIGQGAYLIGSNGSSWSHISSQFNNTIKAFKFNSGDIIKIHLNHVEKVIIFQLKDKQTYKIPFQPIEGDPLHICVLFYYKNDEIEYLREII